MNIHATEISPLTGLRTAASRSGCDRRASASAALRRDKPWPPSSIPAFCCVLLLLGCDTLGGRSVVLKLPPVAPESDIQEVLRVVDRALISEGARRVAASSSDQQHIAHYVGGPFICAV